MLPLESPHLEGLEKPGEKQFQRMYVRQVEKAKNSIFDEISKEVCNSNDHIYIASRYFKNKKGITKEKLGEWLETVCHLLDEFCLPWLQRADDDIQTLNCEKLADQRKVIDLQNQLIVKQEEQLSAVKTTVATEMKTYSAAVSKSCTAALAPKKIQAAVMKVADTNERSKNVIVYGLEEKTNEQLQNKIEEVLVEIGEKPPIEHCVRVGEKKDGTVRPVKFSLRSNLHVQRILSNARKLRTKDGFGSIYISPDRSLDERRAYKKLVEELKLKRSKEPDKVHVIKNNKIVSFNRDSEPVVSGKS
jgi:hypothetical protein